MNTANLKDFAPAARTMLLEAVKNRALKVGVTPSRVEPLTVEGDFVSIGGIRYPRRIADLRTKLLAKISRDGFHPVMEEAAFTWFNRLIAIRYMEVRGYLKHGYRVLSDPTRAITPEILSHAQNIDIAGLDKRRVLELLADGSKQEELYQLLLLAQCHELSDSMPFLFDRIDGANELLTPDGLLASDSIIRKIVKDIPEGDWQTTEILGWLYQFYVSDEKARVDAYVKNGKAVEPADIPAKTQLFTPNWIVQFMVQNSLGRLWLDVYPKSDLKSKMPYFCPSAEQLPEVDQQLSAMVPHELDPTKLTAIDPAAGSGHILLELYNLFFAMYREQGYLPADIPRQIIERNLFGLELDRRAAQIAGFAVLMRARKDDPRLLENPPKVNVIPIRHSRNLDLQVLLGDTPPEPIVPSENLFEDASIQPKLTSTGRPLMSNPKLIRELCRLFNDADVEGSLIRIPEYVVKLLGALEAEITTLLQKAGLYAQEALRELMVLVRQAQTLSARYSVCVANPPYMGGKSQCKALKEFLKKEYAGSDKDVFAAFFVRGQELSNPNGYLGFMSPFTWMFISTFSDLRRQLIDKTHLCTWVQLEYSGFEGATVPICTFTLRNRKIANELGTYIRLTDFKGAESQSPKTLEAIADPQCGWLYFADQDDFKKIPGSPISYFTTPKVRGLFEVGTPLAEVLPPRAGTQTGDNARFVRSWWEVSLQNIHFGCRSHPEASKSLKKWFPLNKGGDFRRWFGNHEEIVDWAADGKNLLAFRPRSVIRNKEEFFRPSASWNLVTSGAFGSRFFPVGFICDIAAPAVFGDSLESLSFVCCALNSTVVKPLMADFCPTLNFTPGDVGNFPLPSEWMHLNGKFEKALGLLVDVSRTDWNDYEVSWEFNSLSPRLTEASSARSWWTARGEYCDQLVATAIRLEEENNHLVAEAYGLTDEVTVAVPRRLATLWANPEHVFRPKKKKKVADDEVGEESLDSEELALADAADSKNALEIKFREKGLKELVSYSIGCMMGRYSLDELGLVYAEQNNDGFDSGRYQSFAADSDGILPITDEAYFGNGDIANRFAQWVQTVWSNSSVEENLGFIAETLGCRADETPIEAIRRYLNDEFYGDHLQTYKKRPIYWMFASGKKKAFQALVYLHRYNSSTLSRMRSDYVGPLIRMFQAQLDEAKKAEDKATSGSQRTTAAKHSKKLREQLDELLDFDKRLHHYALEQIELDLDDGVKVNYGKFSDPKVGDILAKVKEITGGKDD